MENQTRVFIPERALKLMTALLAVPVFRKAGKRILLKKIDEKLTQLKTLGIPTRMVEDQQQMFKNLIRVMDRWLTDNRISRNRMEKFFFSFTAIVNEKNRIIIEGFQKRYGYPPPKFITLSPTKKCNLACKGCYAASAATTDISLPWDITDKILTEQKSLWGAHFTTISGGEPLLYQSQGKTLLDLCEKHNDIFFLMYTNGTQITKETAKRMADLGNITPSISVEGYEAETDERRGRGVYGQILKAIDNLKEAGVLFGVSITVTKNNVDIIFREEFRKTYFNDLGAYYGWIFQYMPIGRKFSLDLVIPPEKRLEMFKKTRKWIYEEGIVLPDFWNSAVISNGCISAAKDGGYLYIDWNGNVMPCVFNPYTVSNIRDIYGRGGSLNDIVNTPFFKKIRQWQEDYFEHGDRADGDLADGDLADGDHADRNFSGSVKGNQLTPCPIRDHYGMMRRLITETGAQPADENADIALEDEEYYRGMVAYGEKIREITRETWEKEYLELG